MNFLKKFAVYGGLAGWALAIAVSLTQYRLIAGSGCTFLSAWPFCGNAVTALQMFVQLIALAGLFGLLIWGGRSALRAIDGTALRSRRSVYTFILASLLGALLLVPFASADLEYYFNAGKALDAGQNLYAGPWHLHNSFIEPIADFQAGEIMYGPLMMPLLAGVYRLSGGSIVSFIALWKLLMVVVFALCGYLTFRLVRMRTSVDKDMFLFLWATQPLLLFEWIGNGHFDGLWLATVLGAFLFAQRRWWWFSFPLLAVGVWIKFIPILVAPWFLLWWWQDIDKKNWKKETGQIIVAGVLSALVTWLAWRPYWVGPKVFKAILLQSKWAVSSLFSSLYYSLLPAAQAIFGYRAHWFLTRAVQGLLLLLAFYLLYPHIKKAVLILFKRAILSDRGYAAAMFVSLLVYLVVWQKSFWPWYFSWLIPIGLVAYAGTGDPLWKKVGVWIGTAPLLFYVPWMLAKGNASGLWFYWYVVAVVMAYPLWQLMQWRRNRYNEIT